MLGQHPVINPIASGDMLHMRLREVLIHFSIQLNKAPAEMYPLAYSIGFWVNSSNFG